MFRAKILKQSSNLLAEYFHMLGNNCLNLCPQTVAGLVSGLHANIINLDCYLEGWGIGLRFSNTRKKNRKCDLVQK